MSSVVQAWVSDLSMMQQTVLFTGIRGPDGIAKYGPTKFLLRWFRRCVLLSAMDGAVLTNPYDQNGGSFTGPSFQVGNDRGQTAECLWEPQMSEVLSGYLRDLDAIPRHFQLHFMHAAEIVGYKHPDLRIRNWWRGAYERLVHDMHLWPETEDQLDRRLGDSRAGWLERADPATVA